MATIDMRLQRHLFFSLFPPEAVKALMDAATVEQVPAGTTIFSEGDTVDCLYLVLDGRVRILKTMPSDPPHMLTSVEGDGFFGEYGVLDGVPRSASAVAAIDSTLARIPREPLLLVVGGLTGAQVMKLVHHIFDNIRATNRRYVQELVQRMRMSVLGESLNSIVHDFRNPMTVIGMAAAVMRQQSADPLIHDNCATIDEQVTRMNAMAEDVLDFSRGVVRLDQWPIHLPAFLDRFDRLNRDYLRRANVAFHVDAADVWLLADAQKLLRVMQNLVNNAVEMFGEDGTGEIRVRGSIEGQNAVLAVTDNGPGIPDAVRPRLFEAFATAGKPKGIGLGLAIVKAIVTSHRGTIDVETAAGRGTTFHLRLPRCQPDGKPLCIDG